MAHSENGLPRWAKLRNPLKESHRDIVVLQFIEEDGRVVAVVENRDGSVWATDLDSFDFANPLLVRGIG